MIYRFDEFELDTGKFELRLSGTAVKVEPQVFGLIELLVTNHDRMVSKDEINLHVWGGRVVSEAVVNSRIRAARQAIGDDGKAQRLIKTIHRRGFRFVGEVTRCENRPAVQLIEATDAPFATAKDVADDTASTRPSIAVMPLQMMTPDMRYANLGDAISQEIIIELSRLHWLFVIARGSSFQFRDPALDLAEAGRILGARYILTGTISLFDARSIVTVELSEAATQNLVWAERYENSLDDLLQLRLAVAAQIVTVLETRIQLAEATRASSEPTENLDAWSAYHRGLWHMYRFNKHDNEIAARLFERAVSADDGFARAYAGLSFTHFQNAFLRYSPNIAGESDRARKFAEKSMSLDGLDPFVNLTMGRTEWLNGSMERAVPWLQRSIDLNPNYAFALYNKGLMEALLGAGETSQDNVMKAIALSPIDPLHYAMLASRALSHLVREDYAEAAQWANRAADAPNAHIIIYVISAVASELSGNQGNAQRKAAEIRDKDPRFKRETFLRTFSFRDGSTRAAIEASLDRLGL